jgi:hypothetical protein
VSSADPGVVAAHLAALAALEDLAGEIGPDTDPATLATRLAALVETRDESAQALDLSRTYVFAARVGAAAADHERSRRWLEGWLAAPRRTWEEAQAAIVDGIRFGRRLHRALGIPTTGDG